LALTPAVSLAQTAVLRGRVLGTQEKPLAAAEIGVVDGRLSVEAGPDGGFTLDGIAPGRSTFFVRAIGYRWVTAVLTLSPGDTLDQTFRLEPAVLTLPEVRVEARWAKPARLAHTTKYDDFYRRRKAGHGTFLTRDRIDAANALRSFELLRGVSGVKVSWNPPGVPRSTP
jgi:iron complex outermembrane receptor protein/hemoglobin/transferrin/lactoferrin receptor protein